MEPYDLSDVPFDLYQPRRPHQRPPIEASRMIKEESSVPLKVPMPKLELLNSADDDSYSDVSDLSAVSTVDLSSDSLNGSSDEWDIFFKKTVDCQQTKLLDKSMVQ